MAEMKTQVAVIGAGPSGLSCAYQLARQGYSVTVYEMFDRGGGMLRFGIPIYRLPDDILDAEIQKIADLGVDIKYNTKIGKDITFDEIQKANKAVYVSIGAHTGWDMNIPGEDADNVWTGADFLHRSNAGEKIDVGDHVVIIGGGDTAMDCVRTAVRQGATSVQCLYRRDRANMPGSMREVAHAEEEGIEFVWQAAPEAFLGDGTVNGVRAVRMRLGASDATGRQRPEVIPDSGFTLKADLVIKALGFDPEDLPALFGEPDLEVTRWGTVKIDWDTMMTPMDGVFAGGDIVRGASLVVWGVKDGRDAAVGIHDYLQNKVALPLEESRTVAAAS